MLKLIYPFFRFSENNIFAINGLPKRNLIITSNLVGLDLEVHNGRATVIVDIRNTMVGHSLGAYAFTKITGKGVLSKKKGAKHLKGKKVKKMPNLVKSNLGKPNFDSNLSKLNKKPFKVKKKRLWAIQ
jgi:ribosomal protein S19